MILVQNVPFEVRALAAFGERRRVILIICMQTGKKKKKNSSEQLWIEVPQIIKSRGGSG